ncbi:MAG: OmpA family protein [Bacteroidota bacterium]
MKQLIQLFGTLSICCLLALPSSAQLISADRKVILTNEATINSPDLEYSPTFYEDGIVFISTKVSKKRYKVRDTRIDQNIMSIFRSRRSESGLLKTPEPFATELLTPVHEGPMSFDRTNEHIYFTRNNYKNGKRKKAKDGIVKLKIYMAERKDSSWVNVVELPFNDDESNAMHPSLSVDGDLLFFASDRPGGLGANDLYVCKREGDSWGEPINLGPSVNTEADEVFPYLHADGTLYFASRGHSGYGGLDIFSATKIGDSYTKPINLEKPFNSEGDDFGFIVDRDKKNGYLSSNRDGGRGSDDIYSFYIATNLDDVTNNETVAPSPTERNIDILVIDHESGDPVVEAQVSYMNLDDFTIAKAITSINNGEQPEADDEVLLRLSMDENSEQGITDYGGKYPLQIANGNYVVNIQKPGYQPRLVVLTSDSDLNELSVSLKKVGADDVAGTNGDGTSGSSNPDGSNSTSNSDDDPYNDVIVNTTISEGTVFELPNIYYNFNDATIRPDASLDLDALAEFLKQYPDIEIELASHTDARGEPRYNRRLSQKRAENAVDYLVSKGVGYNRLQPMGYGESEIRNHCQDGISCTEPEHQYNRRTEVRIVKIDKDINIRFINVAPETTTDNYDDPGSSYDTADSESNYGNSGTGDYKVIAGVFKSVVNAEKRLGQLTDKGLYSAEIISFGNSDLHSVVVERFDSLQDAQDFRKSLKKDYGFRGFIKR